jgi:hypothetical protein
VLSEGSDHPQRPRAARLRFESSRRRELSQRLDPPPRKSRPAEAGMCVIQKLRVPTERRGPREERRRLRRRTAAEPRILSQHDEVVGHRRTVSGTIGP